MQKSGLLTLLLLALWALPGCARPEATLTRELRIATFKGYADLLEREFPDLSRSGIDWNAQRERFLPLIENASDPADFYSHMGAFLCALNDPHVSLKPGTARPESVSTPGRPMVGLIYVGGRLYLRPVRTVACEPSIGDGYPRVLAIDGVEPRLVLAGLMLSGSVGRPVTFDLEDDSGNRYTRTLPREVSNIVPGFGGAARIIHPAFMEGTVLRTDLNQSKEFELPLGNGSSALVTPSRISVLLEPRDSPVAPSANPSAKPAARPSQTARPGGAPWPDWLDPRDFGSFGYLRLSTFSHEDSGLSRSRMADLVLQAVQSLAHRDRLIIDVRYNGGGNDEVLEAAMARFIGRGLTIPAGEYRKFLGLVTVEYKLKIRPRAPLLTPRIAILVNGWSGSCSEHFAALMRWCSDAVVVGEQTIGAEAGVRGYRGPDGSSISIGYFPLPTPDAPRIQSRGVTPDIVVPLSISRIRSIGYTLAVTEAELDQFRAACHAIGVDPSVVFTAPAQPGQSGSSDTLSTPPASDSR